MEAYINKWIFLIFVVGSVVNPAYAELSSVSDKKLQAVIGGEHRSETNKARDRYRHPYETLSWFGVEKNMTVVEIFPGGGWYSEIIAPYLKDSGQYYGAGFDADSDIKFFRENARRFKDKVASNPEVYGNAIVTELAPPNKTAIAPAGSADRVLTFRNVHNWMKGGYAQGVFEAMYTALKPGGIMGLVEHRGDESVKQDPKAESGYVNQSYVIQLAEQVGFELIASSEINANPKDTKNHPKGVWTLPPSLRLKDQDREKYLAIGESDRMTLLFRKP